MKKYLIYGSIAVSLISVFLSTPAHAALILDASSSAKITATSGGFAFTVTSTANPVLVCSSGEYGSAGHISGIKYANVDMTLIASTTSQTSHVAIYILVNPATGSNRVTSTWSATSESLLTCISFAGADQSTGYHATSTAASTGSPSAISVSSTANEYMFETFVCPGTVTAPISGETQVSINNSMAHVGSGSGRRLATTTTVAGGWTHSCNQSSEAAVTVKASGGAAANATGRSSTYFNSSFILVGSCKMY